MVFTSLTWHQYHSLGFTGMFLTLVSVNKLIKITSKSSERHADCYYSSSVLITDLNLHLKNQHGNSQWLGLCTSTAGGVSLIPDEPFLTRVAEYLPSTDKRVTPRLLWRNGSTLAFRVVHGVTGHLLSWCMNNTPPLSNPESMFPLSTVAFKNKVQLLLSSGVRATDNQAWHFTLAAFNFSITIAEQTLFLWMLWVHEMTPTDCLSMDFIFHEIQSISARLEYRYIETL